MQRDTFTEFGTRTVVLLPQSSNTWQGWTYKAEVGYDLTENSLLCDEIKSSVSWLYARYGSYVQRVAPGYSLTPGAPVTSNPFLSDTDLPYIPKVSGVASYSHTWPSVLGGSLIAQLATQFQSSALQVMAQDPVYGVVVVRSAGWGMGDASLKYQSNSSKWSVQLYVHNFTNRLAATTEGYSTTTHATTESFYPPRVIGGIISAQF